jgi:hypothetical protein
MAADRNGDGGLDKGEFLSFSHPEEDEAMKPLIVDQVAPQTSLNVDTLRYKVFFYLSLMAMGCTQG